MGDAGASGAAVEGDGKPKLPPPNPPRSPRPPSFSVTASLPCL